MATIDEIFDKVNETDRELAVWRKLVEFLSLTFLSRDSTPASEQLTLDSGAVIPETTIQGILDIILEEQIAPRETLRRGILSSKFKLLASDTSKEKKKTTKKLAESNS